MNEHPETTETPTPTITEIAPETNVTVVKEKFTSRFRPLIALLIGVAVAVGGYLGYERLTLPIAATVDGEKITEAELQDNVDMMIKSAELQGADVSDPAVAGEIRTQALTNLINNELLMEAARKAGFSTNEAAVKTAYDTLVTEVGGEEALKTRMESVGLSSETLMGNISDRLMVDAYIEAETEIKNIAITDEEIKTYLESVNTEGVTLPPLEEIRPQIEATLIAGKQQEIVNTLLETLRGEADIVINE